MCEELTLLPCPACKNTNVVLRVDTRAYGFCPACGMCGPCAPKVDAEYAIRQWNALPRALEWTDEPSEGARVVLVQKRRRQASDIADHAASEVESRTRR